LKAVCFTQAAFLLPFSRTKAPRFAFVVQCGKYPDPRQSGPQRPGKGQQKSPGSLA